MPDSTADTVLAIIRYIERYRTRTDAGPPAGKEFRESGAVAARIEGGTDTGATAVTVRSTGHAWRLRVFAAARRVKVRVKVEEME